MDTKWIQDEEYELQYYGFSSTAFISDCSITAANLQIKVLTNIIFSERPYIREHKKWYIRN